MIGCYLITLPFKFMHSQANFELAYTLSYFLAWDIQPLEYFWQLIWLDLNYWQVVHLELPEVMEKVEPNLAAGGFLELLYRLWDMFLQVSITHFFSYFIISFTILFIRTLANFYIAIYRMLHCYSVSTHNTTYLRTLFLKVLNIYNLRRL